MLYCNIKRCINRGILIMKKFMSISIIFTLFLTSICPKSFALSNDKNKKTVYSNDYTNVLKKFAIPVTLGTLLVIGLNCIYYNSKNDEVIVKGGKVDNKRANKALEQIKTLSTKNLFPKLIFEDVVIEPNTFKNAEFKCPVIFRKECTIGSNAFSGSTFYNSFKIDSFADISAKFRNTTFLGNILIECEQFNIIFKSSIVLTKDIGTKYKFPGEQGIIFNGKNNKETENYLKKYFCTK